MAFRDTTKNMYLFPVTEGDAIAFDNEIDFQ